eukprot:gb/GECG01003909.1/.p1 GENE.gb/GECG01003909.1/~~gb/GECG01003909.1/.p1  ORF type:complete len:126 (+),score=9.79 gb/GECG01003909.1/:1-378(+)
MSIGNYYRSVRILIVILEYCPFVSGEGIIRHVNIDLDTKVKVHCHTSGRLHSKECVIPVQQQQAGVKNIGEQWKMSASYLDLTGSSRLSMAVWTQRDASKKCGFEMKTGALNSLFHSYNMKTCNE